MTRTSWLSAVSCTALLAGIAAAGCGDTTSVISHDAGPGTGGAVTEGGSGGHIAGGSGGHVTGSGGMIERGTGGAPGGMGGMFVRPGTGGRVVTDAGPPPPPADGGPAACMPNAMCAAGFTCDRNCFAGGGQGMQACMCSAAGRVMCGACMVADAGPPPPPPADGGPGMCTAGAMCAAGFTCDETCMILGGGGQGTRACTCSAAGRVTCGACRGDGGAPPPPFDAGAICANNAMCTTGATCEATCRMNGMNGTRACMCGANGRYTCAPCTVGGGDAAAD